MSTSAASIVVTGATLLLVSACGGGDAGNGTAGGEADATTSGAASEFCTRLAAVAEHRGGMSTPSGMSSLRALLAVSPEAAQAYPRLVLHILDDPVAAMDDNSVSRLDTARVELNKTAEEECGTADLLPSSSLQ